MRLWNSGLECAGSVSRIFTSANNSWWTCSSTQARTGTYSLRAKTKNQVHNASITIAPATAELFVAFGFYPNSSRLQHRIFQMVGLDVQQVIATYQLKFTVAAGAFTTPAGVPRSQWSHVQIRYLRHATLGVLQVRVEGNLVIDQQNINTGSGVPTYARWCMENLTFTSEYYMYFDDIVINDSSGGSDNSWPGDVRLEPAYVNAVGDESDWTLFPDGGEDDYEDIEEIPADDDTTYLVHDVDGEDFLVNLADWSGSGKVPQKVHIWGCVRKEVANAGDQARFIAKQGGVTVAGAAIAPLTTYRMYLETLHTAPDGGAWEDAKIDALQVGGRIYDA